MFDLKNTIFAMHINYLKLHIYLSICCFFFFFETTLRDSLKNIRIPSNNFLKAYLLEKVVNQNVTLNVYSPDKVMKFSGLEF